MLTLQALRHSFFAAWAAPLVTILACLMPIVPYCVGFMPLVPHFAGERQWIGSETDLVLSVRYDGTLLIGQSYVAQDCLEAELREALSRAGERHVVLQIDRRSPFRGTRDILSALRSAGVRRVVLSSGIHAVTG